MSQSTAIVVDSRGDATHDPGHYELPFPRVPVVGEHLILPNGRHGIVLTVTWDFKATPVGVRTVVGIE